MLPADDAGPGVSTMRNLAAGAGAVASARAFDLAASYAFYLVLAHAVSTADFGRLAIAMTVAQTAGVVARLGLDSATMRRVAEAAAARQRSIGSIVGRGTIVSGALSLAMTAALAAAVALVPQLAPYRAAFTGANWSVLLAIPFLATAAIVVSALRGRGEVARAAMAESVLQPAFALAMVCLALWSGRDVFASAALLVSTIAALVFAAMRLAASGALHRGGGAAGLVSLGLRVVAFSSLNAAANEADVLLLTRASSPATVALYAAALKTARAILLVNDATLITVAPAIPSLLRANDRERLGDVCRTVVRWNALLTAPAALLFIAAAEPILSIFGRDFTAAAPLLRIHAVTCALSAFAGPVKSVLLMTGHERLLTRNAVLHVAITVALLLVLVPPFGAAGAAAALMAATVIQRLLLVILVRRTSGIEPIGGRNAVVLAAFVCAVAVDALLLRFGAPLAGAAAAAIFVAGALVAGFDRHDADVLRGLFARRSGA